METVPVVAMSQAALWGFLHALIPCAHSWPMLLPFVRNSASPLRPALLFGAGQLLISLVFGALVGGAVGAIPEGWHHRAEEVTGGILIALGLMIFLWPSAAHLGHVHGECLPETDPACGHPHHEPRRFQRLGPSLGLLALGITNMAIPCWTNLAALALAVNADGPRSAMLVLGTFGFVAAITMALILALLHRGLRSLDRLTSGRAEAWLLRCSAFLLVAFGLTLLLHWHEH